MSFTGALYGHIYSRDELPKTNQDFEQKNFEYGIDIGGISYVLFSKYKFEIGTGLNFTFDGEHIKGWREVNIDTE